jgi:hypothetical protein
VAAERQHEGSDNHDESLQQAEIVAGVAAKFNSDEFWLWSAMLFGVDPADPAVFAGVAAFIGLVPLVACGLPALRAVKLDSTITLRAA